MTKTWLSGMSPGGLTSGALGFGAVAAELLCDVEPQPAIAAATSDAGDNGGDGRAHGRRRYGGPVTAPSGEGQRQVKRRGATAEPGRRYRQP